jgi:hypothetical protein
MISSPCVSSFLLREHGYSGSGFFMTMGRLSALFPVGCGEDGAGKGCLFFYLFYSLKSPFFMHCRGYGRVEIIYVIIADIDPFPSDRMW